MPTISLADLRFLLSRVRGEWLPEELGGLAPLGPTGIRDVQGIGNGTLDPSAGDFWLGAADTLFDRLTFNRLLDPIRKNDVTSAPFANSPRGPNEVITIGGTTTVNNVVVDALNPRNISNIIADSSNPIGFQSLDPNDPFYDIKLNLKLQDDPTGGRVSPVSGAVNPLPYSNWLAQFGQFFDHGLDFVAKGLDGKVSVQLLPSDGLYSPSSPYGPITSFTASRSNTAGNITIGDGSTDALLSNMGLLAKQGAVTWGPTSVVTDPTGSGTVIDGLTYKYAGTFVLNNTLIRIQAKDEVDLVNQINQWTPTTGVTAAVQPWPVPEGSFNLTLSPTRAESFNQVSPFIDLSQSYGSDLSRTFFLKEYNELTEGLTVHDVTTGYMVNAGATVNGQTKAGIANWQQIKANAAKVGITLHDADVLAIPMVATDANGQLILSANGGLQLIALNKVTGEIVYVTDTNVAPDLVLMTTQHAFLNDMGVRLPALTDTNFWDGRDVANPQTKAALEAHYITGDGRTNENLGLTAVQEVFLTHHNQIIDALKAEYGFVGDAPPGGWTWTDPLTNVTTTITAAELFEQAKLVNEMTYQHLVFDQFVRKLSPNIDAFIAVVPGTIPDITSEFANAVYRLGHSMLPDAIGMRQSTDATHISTTSGSDLVTVAMTNHGLSTGASVTLDSVDADIGGIAASALNGTYQITVVDANTFTISVGAAATSTATGLDTDRVTVEINKGLIDAFLNPSSYIPGYTSALLSDGANSQVGMRIDEKVTDALRDNLLGQPLDLATLNLVRGRDAGIPTLNEMRASLASLAPPLLQPTLNPYTSWTNFRDNLKGSPADQAATVKNFMMAYASDAILTQFASSKTLAQWYTLRESTNPADQQAYMDALKAATNLAYANATFMGSGGGGNKDFNRIDAWIGGLAEKEVVGGMLGATFDAVFSMQIVALQNGDHFYYLGRIPLEEFFNENMEGRQLSDIVMKATGATGVYADIFSVADSYIEMGDAAGQATFADLAELQAATTSQQVFDTNGNVITADIGTAGFVGGVFYGNPGNYVDARGVLNPNGAGNASERITATSGNDTVLAGGGNDDVRGGDGDDSIDGGSGVDFLYGDGGNDTIDGGSDNDFIYAGEGNDLVRGGLGADLIFGDDGDDTIYGGIDADRLIGGKGNDVLYGGDGNVVDGILDPDTDVVAQALVDDVLMGGAGDDTLYGGGGWDDLTGDSGHDMLLPGAGGVVFGGREVMNGGEGDDIYIIEDAEWFQYHDIADNGLTQLQLVNKGTGFREGNGLGIDEVRFTQTEAGNIVIGGTDDLGILQTFTGVERIVIGTGTGVTADRSGTAAINIDASLADPGFQVGLEILGNAGENYIVGTSFADTIDGGGGSDIMEGGLGNDTYIVDSVDDVIDESTGGGTDTVIVDAPINYTLQGDLENLILRSTALEGTGNNLNNVMVGNESANTLSGLGGNDSLDGGAGNDTLIGGAGNDTIDGGEGTDTVVLSGQQSAYVLITEGGAIKSTGTDGTDFFRNVEFVQFDDGVLDIVAATANYTLTVDQDLIDEGDSGTTEVTFTITRDKAGTASTVTFRTTGNASAADVTGVPATIAFGVGELEKTFTVSVVGDTTIEGNETFGLLIDTVSEIAAYSATATSFVITNDDSQATTGDDSILGTPGDDFIEALAGNDTINGAGGSDTIDGGEGNDLVILSGSGDNFHIRQTIDGFTVDDRANGTSIVLRDVEAIQTDSGLVQLASDLSTLIKVSTLSPADSFMVLPTPYSGPVSGLEWQHIGGAGNEIVGGTSGNDFINGLGGDDAIDGGAGDDVLDGGTGSNFLTGGAGRDIFFLDARGSGAPTWSTITDWEAGEELSIWGWKEGTSQSLWVDDDGVDGYRGRTLHVDIDADGTFDASVTWAGLTEAQVPTPNFDFADLVWFR